MAEWFKAAVLKTVVRKYRGFESYSLRHKKNTGEMTELADGARLLSECGGNTPPRVRIPLSPPDKKPDIAFVDVRLFFYCLCFQCSSGQRVIGLSACGYTPVGMDRKFLTGMVKTEKNPDNLKGDKRFPGLYF